MKKHASLNIIKLFIVLLILSVCPANSSFAQKTLASVEYSVAPPVEKVKQKTKGEKAKLKRKKHKKKFQKNKFQFHSNKNMSNGRKRAGMTLIIIAAGLLLIGGVLVLVSPGGYANILFYGLAALLGLGALILFIIGGILNISTKKEKAEKRKEEEKKREEKAELEKKAQTAAALARLEAEKEAREGELAKLEAEKEAKEANEKRKEEENKIIADEQKKEANDLDNNGLIKKLKDLAALKEDGIITEEEFLKIKSNLLKQHLQTNENTGNVNNNNSKDESENNNNKNNRATDIVQITKETYSRYPNVPLEFLDKRIKYNKKYNSYSEEMLNNLDLLLYEYEFFIKKIHQMDTNQEKATEILYKVTRLKIQQAKKREGLSSIKMDEKIARYYNDLNNLLT